VVVCGSMFLVGLLRARVLAEPVDPTPTSDPVFSRNPQGVPNLPR
jgi:hypothetical protein